MSRVLVTGGSGFIGRHVLPELVLLGAEVHACSRATSAPMLGVTWHRVDVMDQLATGALIDDVRPEVLLHLAWFTTPPDYWRSPVNLRWMTASLELAEAFIRAGGRRFVGVGTCAEYSWDDGRCVERLTPIRPATLYGGCKAGVWSALEPFARDAGVSAAWARLFFVYGPHEARTRLVPSLVMAMQHGERARCRAASHVRDFLYVSDAGAALAALTMSAVTGAVNIASGEAVGVGAMAEGIARRVNRLDLLDMEDGPPQDAMVVADVERLRNEVGWQPRLSLDAGLDRAVAWWLSCAAATDAARAPGGPANVAAQTQVVTSRKR